MKLLLTNIKELLQVREESPKKLSGSEMKTLPTIKNAWIFLNQGKIEDFGSMDNLPQYSNTKTIDCTGRIVLPTWCDSHTHLVYAGNREQEFVDRINGLSYQEIAERGGGIVNSAQKLQNTSEEALYEQTENRLLEIMQIGRAHV